MRAGATDKTTSPQNQVLRRALAGAFLLLALRVEPAAACAADAASSILCRRTSWKQRALSANFKLRKESCLQLFLGESQDKAESLQRL